MSTGTESVGRRPERAAVGLDAERETRARIDVTDASADEVRSFVDRAGCPVHLERRGARTTLVVRAKRR